MFFTCCWRLGAANGRDAPWLGATVETQTTMVALGIWHWASVATSLQNMAQSKGQIFISIEGWQQQQLPRLSPHLAVIRAYRAIQIACAAVGSSDDYVLESAK